MPIRSLLPLTLLAATLAAQTTHLVGPGGFAQIRDAIAVAAPGDVITVAAGTYAHFVADKALTIRALAPGSVHIAFDPSVESAACLANPFCAVGVGVSRFQPPAGQAVHVAGLAFDGTTQTIGIATIRHRVVVTSGTATFDTCTMHAYDSVALTIDAAQVHLQNCVVGGQGLLTAHGVDANGANLIAVDSTLGGSQTAGFALPGDAVRLTNSTLKASGCTLVGGSNFFGGVGGAALRCDAASRVWISDSTVTGGGTTCAVVGTPAVGHIARSTAAPVGPACGTLLPAPVVGVERPAPIQNGSTFTVHVHTEPGMLVAIHGSPRLAQIEVPGVFAQPIALDLTAFFLAGVYVSDANGDVTASWNMPAGQYVDETVWLEASAWGPTPPVLVAPVIGGVIR
ncbi:MAG: hypothetical protein JNL08_11785 [Planctomycetes bacterium]|nr:hypothetical protein [Planctomycetota bacterium]